MNPSEPSDRPNASTATSGSPSGAGFLNRLASRVRASRLRAIVIEGPSAPPSLETWLEEAGLVLDDDEASVRHADLLVVAGRMTLRSLPVVQRIWQQMPDPKWLLVVEPLDAGDGTLPYAMVSDPAAFLPVDVRAAADPEAVNRALVELRAIIAATDPPGDES